MQTKTPLLQVWGITKAFPGVLANDHVNLTVFSGEILGLVGENGAGKTTLMRIIYGLERPDAGEIFWKGSKVSISSPQQAMRLGIGMVHQHFQLFPSLSVTENVVLGNEPVFGPLFNRRQAYRRVAQLIEQFGFELDPKAIVRGLSVGQQQKVELLKALYRRVELLILDEPTAVLTPQEVESLLKLLRGLATSGIAIILISHKLREVLTVASRITVMRKGQVVADVKPSDVTETKLATLMVGMEIQRATFPRESLQRKRDKPVLTVQGLTVLNDRGRPAVNSVSFELREGEIIGLVGVEGNGQQELVEALVGVREVVTGRILLNGEDITRLPPSKRRRLGLAVIPGDRLKEGVVPSATVAENLITVKYRRFPYNIAGILRERNIKEFAISAIKEYHIVAEPNTVARNLSGGNIQRLVVARELSTSPLVLIAVHPTRGLDVRSTLEVHERLMNLRARGISILVVSTDLDELLELSDRLLVIFRGTIVGEVSPRATTPEELGLLMLGGTRGQLEKKLDN
jgi:simple sugar transport system ATP-binding protein